MGIFCQIDDSGGENLDEKIPEPVAREEELAEKVPRSLRREEQLAKHEPVSTSRILIILMRN